MTSTVVVVLVYVAVVDPLHRLRTRGEVVAVVLPVVLDEQVGHVAQALLPAVRHFWSGGVVVV